MTEAPGPFMPSDFATRQFSLLTAVLQLARSQWSALELTDLARFQDFRYQRQELIAELHELRAGHTAMPVNVVRIGTELSLGDEADSAIAIDLVIRLIFAQDEKNDWLLRQELPLLTEAS